MAEVDVQLVRLRVSPLMREGNGPCMGCVKLVTSTLEGSAGVVRASFDQQEEVFEVTVTSAFTLADAAERVRATGLEHDRRVVGEGRRIGEWELTDVS